MPKLDVAPVAAIERLEFERGVIWVDFGRAVSSALEALDFDPMRMGDYYVTVVDELFHVGLAPSGAAVTSVMLPLSVCERYRDAVSRTLSELRRVGPPRTEEQVLEELTDQFFNTIDKMHPPRSP